MLKVDRTAIIYKLIGVLALIGTGFVMKYQYERIAGILSGESSESVVPLGKTIIDWDDSCGDIHYKAYGKALEDVLIGAFAFHIGENFPRGTAYDRISYNWDLKDKFYRLSAREISEEPKLFELELLESDDQEFSSSSTLVLPSRWQRKLSLRDLNYALREYLDQVKNNFAKNLSEMVYVSIVDLASGFEHRFVVKNKKIELWSFEGGYCQIEYHEPLYRNISRCKC